MTYHNQVDVAAARGMLALAMASGFLVKGLTDAARNAALAQLAIAWAPELMARIDQISAPLAS